MSKIYPNVGKIAFIVVERKYENLDEHGLIAPTAEEYYDKMIVTGKVIAAGKDCEHNVGDFIIVNLSACIDITITGNAAMIIKDSDIICRVS